MSAKVSVFRKEHFNAAHRLHNASWSPTRNREVFGLCNNEHYHGHNYELIVKLTGLIDSETGYVFDMKVLSDIIKSEVIELMDHKNLNLDVEAFKNVNPTAENISIVIYDLLRKQIPDNLEIQITLYETEKNFVQYPPNN